MRAALQQEFDAEALPLDHRPVQRRHVELVVAVWVGPGRDEVGDVEQLGVAHKHSLLQLPLQRRDIWRLPVDTRPVHLVERSQRGARSEAHAHAHAVWSSEAAGAPPPRVAVCRQGPPPPAARDRRPPARAACRASVRLPTPLARTVDHDKFQRAWRRAQQPQRNWRAAHRSAHPGMRAWLCAAIILAAGLSCASAGADDAAGRVLAESDFSWDMDGWEVHGEGARDEAHMSKMIKAGDNGSDEWYFVAPHKFTGSKREAYGGSLSFRHGFFEFNRSLNPLRARLLSRVSGAHARWVREQRRQGYATRL